MFSIFFHFTIYLCIFWLIIFQLTTHVPFTLKPVNWLVSQTNRLVLKMNGTLVTNWLRNAPFGTYAKLSKKLTFVYEKNLWNCKKNRFGSFLHVLPWKRFFLENPLWLLFSILGLYSCAEFQKEELSRKVSSRRKDGGTHVEAWIYRTSTSRGQKTSMVDSYFLKKLHHRCSTGFLRLWYYFKNIKLPRCDTKIIEMRIKNYYNEKLLQNKSNNYKWNLSTNMPSVINFVPDNEKLKNDNVSHNFGESKYITLKNRSEVLY